MLLDPHDFLNRVLPVRPVGVAAPGVAARDGGRDRVMGVVGPLRLGDDDEAEIVAASVPESTDEDRLLWGFRSSFFGMNEGVDGCLSGAGALMFASVGVVGDSTRGFAVDASAEGFAVGGSAGISAGLGGVGGVYNLLSANSESSSTSSSSELLSPSSELKPSSSNSGPP